MNSEDWFAAMEDDTESNKEEDEKEKEKEEKEKEEDDGFKTPRGKGKETGTPDNPFSHTPPFGLPPNTPPFDAASEELFTPQSTPGTPGKLRVETQGTP